VADAARICKGSLAAEPGKRFFLRSGDQAVDTLSLVKLNT